MWVNTISGAGQHLAANSPELFGSVAEGNDLSRADKGAVEIYKRGNHNYNVHICRNMIIQGKRHDYNVHIWNMVIQYTFVFKHTSE